MVLKKFTRDLQCLCIYNKFYMKFLNYFFNFYISFLFISVMKNLDNKIKRTLYIPNIFFFLVLLIKVNKKGYFWKMKNTNSQLYQHEIKLLFRNYFINPKLFF